MILRVRLSDAVAWSALAAVAVTCLAGTLAESLWLIVVAVTFGAGLALGMLVSDLEQREKGLG